MVLLIPAVLPSACWSAEGTPVRASTAPLPRTTNFSLLDYSGRNFELRRAPGRVVVLYFTGFGCPIARQSVGKLMQLQRDFADQGVDLWLVNAMPQKDPDPKLVESVTMLFAQGQMESVLKEYVADPEETARRIRAFGNMSQVLPRSIVVGDRLEFQKLARQSTYGDLTVLRDDQQILTRQLGVARTCEAIAIDTGTFEIFYRGALDDQMVPGAQKPQATEHYLADALTAYLAGEPVKVRKTATQGCLITMLPETNVKDVSYANDIVPILTEKCVGCHNRENIGPFALSNYDDVVRWSAMMEEVVMDHRMPPWDADPHYGKFKNDSSLTAKQKHQLISWIQAGCPRGEGDDPLAAVPTKPEGWKLGEPDLVLPLPEPQQIPATGVLDYRYLISTVEVPHDVWLRAVVCRPGDPKVVHHMIVRPVYPPGYKDVSEEAYLLSTWAPGVPQRELPPGTGVFLPKGTRCHFEMHYTTDGVEHTDQSEIGLYYAKEPPEQKWEVRVCETRDLQIPRAFAKHHIAPSTVSRKTRRFTTSARICICEAPISSSSCCNQMGSEKSYCRSRDSISIGKRVTICKNHARFRLAVGSSARGHSITP